MQKLISRSITPQLEKLAQQFPVVAVLGPRQSGKTTLVSEDPRRFFASFKDYPGVIIDEIQEVPELLSYMQGIVDEAKKPGQFIITGSQNILVLEKVTQTLAGRIALLTLLPPSCQELADAHMLSLDTDEALINGFYPSIHVSKIDRHAWFQAYITTYVERDVRSVLTITDLLAFQCFLKLCAGRIGQFLDTTSLANDANVSLKTVNEWLSVLHASYVTYLITPYYKKFNKRLIKSPKLYFYDTGLACSLLSIETPTMLNTHYARGAIFESFAISELIKYRYNQGKNPNLYFWRDADGHEIDCVIERGQKVYPIEIQSGMTVNSSFFQGLIDWEEITEQKDITAYVVYAGTENQVRKHGHVVAWNNIKSIIDAID